MKEHIEGIRKGGSLNSLDLDQFVLFNSVAVIIETNNELG